MKKLLLLILSSIFIYGCADSTKITQDSSYHQPSLDKSAVVYVSIPKDGRYGSTTYKDSGRTVSAIIKSSLLKHMHQVDEGKRVESYKQALATAQNKEADYLFLPSVLHWEDRATEWSGKPDKVKIKVAVIDLKNAETISSVTINGSSGLATFGGDHPQDLLPEPVGQYIDSLFK